MGKIPYKAIVGSIMYATIATRLDIMALIGNKLVHTKSRTCTLQNYETNHDFFTY